jgi:hypothetical protein
LKIGIVARSEREKRIFKKVTIEEISSEITEGLEIIPVGHMTEVLKYALVCEG